MKTTMYWMISIILVPALLVIAIALFPKGQAKVGLVAGQLSPCPGTPNCVCSEGKLVSSYIAPFIFDGMAQAAWQRLKHIIVVSGGNILTEEGDYILASFTTRWLRFVDDVEFRMDADSHVIHVRSASRIGRSDLGANRNRVEMLRSLFNSNL